MRYKIVVQKESKDKSIVDSKTIDRFYVFQKKGYSYDWIESSYVSFKSKKEALDFIDYKKRTVKKNDSYEVYNTSSKFDILIDKIYKLLSLTKL